MAVRMGNSYVSEAALAYAQKSSAERAENGGTKNGMLAELKEKFKGLKFSVGTQPFQGNGMGNVSIAPNILREMESNPAKREEYEALLYDVEQCTAGMPTERGGFRVKAQGWMIDKDGGLSCWSIGVSEGGERKPEASGMKRSDKKAWWQKLLEEIQEKKEDRNHKKEKKTLSEADSQTSLTVRLKEQQEEAARMLTLNAEKSSIPINPDKQTLKKAYHTGNADAAAMRGFSNTDDMMKYLQEQFTVVREGMASISSKHLKACLTDDNLRAKLLNNLRTADEILKNNKDNVGFQGMKVTIDEDGEMTVESSKATVTINESKRRRQIAAAATKGDMQAVLAELQQDLKDVEDGLKQNMCDEAEVEKAKRLIEEAKQQMAKLPDRPPTQEEQNIMSINMLI